jgi:hypothetical protein
VDHVGPGRKRKCFRERTDRRAVGHGGPVIGGDYETTRTIAVDRTEHDPRIGEGPRYPDD